MNQNCVRATKPGGTISNIGYHGDGEFVHLPREAWGIGMAEKTIATGLCSGGRLRMQERLLELQRVDPTPTVSPAPLHRSVRWRGMQRSPWICGPMRLLSAD